MKVPYSLKSVFTVVADYSVAVFKAKVRSNIFDFKHEMRNQLFVIPSQGIDTFYMFLRNHKYMYRRLGFQVVEAYNLIILISYI